MLSAVPNIVTDVGDSAMIVGDTGWVVPPGDPAALADAIEKAQREWRDRPADWRRRRVAARESVAARFTFARMIESYVRAWREVGSR
jgi:glycosyltransferase involved in cell wall biosynthesis